MGDLNYNMALERKWVDNMEMRAIAKSERDLRYNESKDVYASSLKEKEED